jgi:diadenosine tetraphosphatase ApaH/serine/threonine PP2A family protein phosphatase
MLHAILSDVHANLEALEAVLADVEKRGAADKVCLGDFVGYGASPNECMSLLCPQIEAGVLGNHDDAAVRPSGVEAFNPDAARAARWTARALSSEHREYLIHLPLTQPWRGARLVHASPSDPAAWNYVFRPGDAMHEMAACTEPVCFVGHSHVPGTFEIRGARATYTRDATVSVSRDRRYLVVVPSVGQPRDGDPRAGYLLWDDEAWTFEHVRLEYDLERAVDRILDAGLPAYLAERLHWGE